MNAQVTPRWSLGDAPASTPRPLPPTEQRPGPRLCLLPLSQAVWQAAPTPAQEVGSEHWSASIQVARERATLPAGRSGPGVCKSSSRCPSRVLLPAQWVGGQPGWGPRPQGLRQARGRGARGSGLHGGRGLSSLPCVKRCGLQVRTQDGAERNAHLARTCDAGLGTAPCPPPDLEVLAGALRNPAL